MNPLNPYFDLYQALEGQPPELQFSLRKKLIWAYSWAIPSPEAIVTIASHGSIVEIGAGNGYWAWLLTQAGADVVAYDHGAEQVPKWFAVRSGDPESVSKHQDRALLLCWPPYNESMAGDALKNYSGSNVIYVGEWGGRTADSKFHQALERDWRVTQTLEIPRWPGFEDRVYFFARNEI